MNVQQTPKSPPKVLFVDDEESILSAARRLLRGRNIEIITATSPLEALEIMTKEDCWVIVSDYRMPEMTGTELLESIKRKFPHVTRLMLTGFLERPVIKEAINRASVFRFITKPWDETELILGIETAIQHSGRRKTNSQLVHEIGVQNQLLEQLTQNLESEVNKRTQGIQESKTLAESKQRLVRELTAFVKNLSRVEDVSELYDVVFHEMRKFHDVSEPYLFLLEGQKKSRLIWRSSRNIREKVVNQIPKHFHSLSVRTSSPDDLIWWKQNVKKQCRSLLAIPIRARETSSTQPVAVMMVEHGLAANALTLLLDRITERLQAVSIVLDKILLREQLVMATQQWEATFNGFNDPIAVLDQQDRVVRANKTYLKTFSGPLQKERSFRINTYSINFASRSTIIPRIVNYYYDTTHERDLYLKLVQSEKLAAVGLFAGNIAHELNNPLSGIRALTQIMQSEIETTNPFLTDIHEIEKAAIRCQQIIKNLLSFSEPSNDSFEEVNLNDMIDSTLPLLKTALRLVNLRKYYDSNLGIVCIQSSQIQQVIFNLINNATQAMGQDGTLTLRTWSEGRYSCFSIADTGSGIPIEIQERIFEPFFTTKGVGVGTGLGLSVSRSIIEKYEGKLSLESSMGRGSTFTVYLPRVIK